MVEHGADEHLRGDRRGSVVACGQGEARGEPAAGTGSCDDDPVGVDAEFVRVLDEPRQSSVGVGDQAVAGCLRREAVVDRSHHGAELVEPLQWNIDLGEAISHDHATTVQPVHARSRGGRLGRDGSEDRYGQLCTVVGDDHGLAVRGGPDGEQFLRGRCGVAAQLCQHLRGQQRVERHRGQKLCELRVEVRTVERHDGVFRRCGWSGAAQRVALPPIGM